MAGSLGASGLAMWLILLASSWGDASGGFRWLQFIAGLALVVAATVIGVSGAARVLMPRQRRVHDADEGC